MIIAFIAARGGSKSIPKKNIKNFCGKPLIFWNLEALSGVEEIDRIYVATDSEDIKKTVLDFGFDKVEVYDRDEKNAQDSSSTESVMLEFINCKKIDKDTTFILSQITCPLTNSSDYKQALDKYNNKEIDSLLSCARMKRFFWSEEGKSINYDYRNRPLRQNFDGILMENGAFYINSVENILHDKNRLSGKIGIHEMAEHTAVDIDEEEDWINAEKIMKKYNLQTKLFLTDVDGCLTDAGMYYSEKGDELKKFNTHDGMGFKILRENNIKTGIITSENTNIVKRRAEKLKVDYLYQGAENKLEIVKKNMHRTWYNFT